MFRIPKEIVKKGVTLSEMALKLNLTVKGKEGVIYTFPISPVKFPDPAPPPGHNINE